ncbi:MAG: polysaccharide biosynthesis/export family protein [Candidatus Caenarcaniphilales bacterium]|nr:polysaccharide biosynthesis/export family protein [Candidatus Caenarcaniphilales bacterium]
MIPTSRYFFKKLSISYKTFFHLILLISLITPFVGLINFKANSQPVFNSLFLEETQQTQTADIKNDFLKDTSSNNPLDLLMKGSSDKKQIKKKSVEQFKNSGKVIDQDLAQRIKKQIDYGQNDSSIIPVFGERLFLGNFARQTFTGFNPNYKISIGDEVVLKLWGAFEYESTLIVDQQGNIFVPKVGPIKLLGVQNKDLNKVVSSKVRSIFSKNVGIYANLQDTHPIKVFVSGFVQRPGLFEGFSSNSALNFLDKAGGIDPLRGSFINIDLIRNQEVIDTINLYDFLLKGTTKSIQLHDGDTVLVHPKNSSYSVSGDVLNSYQFEFKGSKIQGKDIIDIARPLPSANFVKIARKKDNTINSFYISLDEFSKSPVLPDDEIDFIIDKVEETIAVVVEGEHIGRKGYILPHNSQVKDLMPLLSIDERSEVESMQIFRESLAKEQKKALNQSLDALERKLASYASVTASQAQLQNQELSRISGFIEKARNVQPEGRIILAKSRNSQETYLEDKDVVFIPPKTNLVTITGQVYFPNTTVNKRQSIKGYAIGVGGGFVENADKKKAVVIHQDGRAEQVKTSYVPKNGDQLMIVPKVRLKWFPLVKDITDIIFKSALTARVFIWD